MEIYTGLDFELKKSSVCVGKFDGIHRGHRLLIEKIGEKEGTNSTVFTFQDDGKRKKIYTQTEKDAILRDLRVQREVVLPFDEKIKNLSPTDFIREILVGRMDVKFLCVGKDFRFGKDRAGNASTLKKYSEVYGYELAVVPKLFDGDEAISSTRIRRLMREQENLNKVNSLLGEPYFIFGTVVRGKALGEKLDMPTANFLPEPGKILLPAGVYATTVRVEGKDYLGVTNIGNKPTVGGKTLGIETHIIDFADKKLYGERIKVSFLFFLRPEKKFASVEQLRRQMEKDKEKARDLGREYLRDLLCKKTFEESCR